MFIADALIILKWWISFLIIGLFFTPFTSIIFSHFKDKGYLFSKILSLVFISYLVFILAFLKLFSFSFFLIYFVIILFILLNLSLIKIKNINIIKLFKQNYKIILLEEIIFLVCLFFWSYIRGHLPDINGLEKFMDYGFVNAILKSEYFPPKDMWYSGLPINYYYFGHLFTAVFIKLSSIQPSIGYNLMISTLFAFSFSLTFSLAFNIFFYAGKYFKAFVSGLLSAVLLSLAGNLTTIYSFFKPYVNEHPVEPWRLDFAALTFPNNFWYPNATRFIPFTIHEFPIYSFVVSDLHGHVLSIPLVITTVAILFSMYIGRILNKKLIILISFMLTLLYMTNAWDGLIYMLLSVLVLILYFYNKLDKSKNTLSSFIIYTILLISFFFIFLIPFNLNFKPFVSGIGILCSPKFLIDIGNIGPLLFEENHCQKSPLWQLLILYGFFYFFVISFIIFLKLKTKYLLQKSDKFILLLIFLSTILIIVPEFIYIKDIYPMHYRANTMFKLTYEAFMLLSISCGYIIVKIISTVKNKKHLLLFFIPTILLIYLVIAYPVFAINSYYDNLREYKGLDGTKYLRQRLQDDYKIISWLNNNAIKQSIIIEASGDSYTDYARISANTGIPTVIGWSVHEWLWRGTYDIVAPRINDVEILYTANTTIDVKKIIEKYNISYIIVSNLEREKYPNLNEENFNKLGKIIYKTGNSKIYKIN